MKRATHPCQHSRRYPRHGNLAFHWTCRSVVPKLRYACGLKTNHLSIIWPSCCFNVPLQTKVSSRQVNLIILFTATTCWIRSVHHTRLLSHPFVDILVHRSCLILAFFVASGDCLSLNDHDWSKHNLILDCCIHNAATGDSSTDFRLQQCYAV